MPLFIILGSVFYHCEHIHGCVVSEHPFVYVNILLMACHGEGIYLLSSVSLMLLLCSHKQGPLKNRHTLLDIYKLYNIIVFLYGQ